MDGALLTVIAVSIVVAALIGFKSGLTTAFLEILAGISIAAIFGIHELPESLHILSELGIISLMFLAGLEVDLEFIRDKGRKGIAIGLVAFIVPFTTITVLGTYLFGLELEQALLFGIALSECSAGIVYPVLRKKGQLGPRRKIVLSAAMVMELVGILVLTLLFSEINGTLIIAILFVIAMRWLLPYLQNRFHFLRKSSEEAISIKLILALLLVAAFLATSSGIDPVPVVFVLGMLLAHYIDRHETLKQEIETMSFGFFTPVFFVGVGMSITLVVFLSKLPWILAVSAATFGLTFMSIYIMARKILPKRARIVSALLNAPMSIGIIAATIGLEQNIIDTDLYSIMIGAVLLSSLVAIIAGRYPDDVPA